MQKFILGAMDAGQWMRGKNEPYNRQKLAIRFAVGGTRWLQGLQGKCMEPPYMMYCFT
jgi:hypothetical protein